MDPSSKAKLQRSHGMLCQNMCGRGSRLTRWSDGSPRSIAANEIKAHVRKGKADLETAS